MRSSLISAVHGLTPRSESSIDRVLFEKACAVVTAWAASEERTIAAPAEHLLAEAIASSARRYAPRVSELERGCQMVLRPWVGKGRQVALSEIMLWRRSEQRLCTYRSRKPFEKLSGGDLSFWCGATFDWFDWFYLTIGSKFKQLFHGMCENINGAYQTKSDQ